MAKATQKTMEYIDQYQKANIRQVLVKLNRKTETELTEWVESHDNIQGYIKSLILADMQAHQQST